MTAQALYEKLSSGRDNYLRQARRCAELTIPFLFPPDGATSSTQYYTPHQSVGSRGVNNLASKLLIALLPPNSPFFRLVIDRFALKQATDNPKLKTALETALGEVERAVVTEIETSTVRVSVFEAIKHLIVGGNALLYVPASGGVRVFHLSRYVVKRDPMGNVLTIITKESVAPSTLPKAVQKMIASADKDTAKVEGDTEKSVDLYTYVRRAKDGAKWMIHQEIKDKMVPESEGIYPPDRCPFIPLRYSKIDGEDYGRGLAEEVIGDLSSLESLRQSLVEGSAACAKILFLVKPNGTTRIKHVAEAPNGGFVQGDKEDISSLTVDKFYDLKVVQEEAGTITKSLEGAFMLTAGATRQAERVTAEEIRAMVQELESTQGGVYSIQAQELQLPLAAALMHRMEQDKRLPKLPKGIVKPTIVTGLDALGRGNDLQKLDSLIAGGAQIFGPEVVARYVSPGEYYARRAAALGVDTEGLIRTDEELAAEAEAAQQAALAQQVTPELIKQGGAMLQNSQKAALSTEGAPSPIG